MFLTTSSLFIFIAGVLITLLASYGIYRHFVEVDAEFQKKKERKIEYRTEEEFVGEHSP